MTIHPVGPLTYILLRSETAAVRFWFGLTTILFGIFLLIKNEVQLEYVITYHIMPHWVWGLGFIISGVAILRGAITSKYSIKTMLLESVLGTFLWVSIAVSSMMSQDMPGAITIGGLMSLWLLIRYPKWNTKK